MLHITIKLAPGPQEMNWGDSVCLPGLTVISTPTRHFSGRGLTNQNSTFWLS